jgi:hypothetical protein
MYSLELGIPDYRKTEKVMLNGKENGESGGRDWHL